MRDIEISHHRPGELDSTAQVHLERLLSAVADDFVPPLFGRSGTTVGKLDQATSADGLAYFAEMIAQDNLLLTERGSVAAFASFRKAYVVPGLEELGDTVYLSTIAVLPTARHHGYAALLYESLFALPDDYPQTITLRTWSTNDAHIALITKRLGFQRLLVLPNHRGEGVDTVYFGRRRDGKPLSVSAR